MKSENHPNTSNAPVSLSYVIVDYNLQQLVNKAIESILSSSGDFSSVIIVDNYGVSEKYQYENDHRVHVLHQDENLGFAAGCNVGWKLANKLNASVICFLNPDAAIVPSGVAACMDFLTHNVHESAVSGLIQHNGFGKGDLITGAYRMSKYTGMVRRDRDAAVKTEPAYSSFLGGSCFFVRIDTLIQLDGFDESYFLYWEEVDFFLRMTKKTSQPLVLPILVAKHVGGAAVGERASSPVRVGFKSRNFLKICRIYGGRHIVLWFLKWLLFDSVMLMFNGGRASVILHLSMIKELNASGPELLKYLIDIDE